MGYDLLSINCGSAPGLGSIAASPFAARLSAPAAHLMLISTGERYAVAARGRWTAEGAWAWRWKDWIDRRFVQRFQLG